MTAIVFETPGHIDVRAFTIMGAHAKPNSKSPIGYFGTGLKYALATLVRNGAEPVVWIGKDRFSFGKVESSFRGVPLETIRMRVLKDGNIRATSYELPFTTAMGKNWEVWMAFRELESNTRDEGGSTWHDTASVDRIVGLEGSTRIVVDLPAFIEAWEKRADIFLEGASVRGEAILEAFPSEGDRLWYRSMRVLDLNKPSIFTYNFLEEMQLTEDRSLKYEFYAKQAVARWVLSAATEEQVEKILTADKDAWEYGLEFPALVKPSAAYEAVMTSKRRGISRNAWTYYSAYVPRRRERRADIPWSVWEEHPTPWKVEGLAIVDANGSEVFVAPEGYYDDWERTANAILKRIRAIPES